MRIGFISDLHIDFNRQFDFLEILSQVIADKALDTVVFLGDTSTGAKDALRFYDALAVKTKAQVRIVPGNHDMYVENLRRKSKDRINRESSAFHDSILFHKEYSLMENPIVTKHWYITGIGGWFDYSFGKRKPGNPPGKAANSIISRFFWPDQKVIHGGVIDYERDVRLVMKDIRMLQKSFEKEAAQGKKRCVVMHMLPIGELIRAYPIPFYNKLINQLGSERYRHFFEKNEVSLSISGHSHMPMKIQKNGIRYVNVSLGYTFQWTNPADAYGEISKILYILEDCGLSGD
ncbi:MAG: metallophosphoesterase [Clostridiales bacterium]|nr:metallophosphoesterase family protein [Clostridiales bacterium]MDU3239571.1 metallophosphoesterase [Clostridiales bacterium]